MITRTVPSNRSTSSVVETSVPGVRLRVSTSHNKDRKTLGTLIAREFVDGGIVRVAPYEDMQVLSTVPVSRYSEKALVSQQSAHEALLCDSDWLQWAEDMSSYK